MKLEMMLAFLKCLKKFWNDFLWKQVSLDLFWGTNFYYSPYLQNVEIAALKEVRKVKSIQIFRKPAQQAIQGDRAGICVTQFDASLLERGLVSSPGLLPTAFGIIIELRKIRYYKGDIVSGAKFHVSIGHSTILSTITLFCEELVNQDDKNAHFSFDNDYSYLPSLTSDESNENAIKVYALLEFDHSAVIAANR